MSRMPALKYREVGLPAPPRLRVSATRKGSHEFWINRRTGKVTMVTCHPGDIPRGTLRAIIEQTGLTVDEFVK